MGEPKIWSNKNRSTNKEEAEQVEDLMLCWLRIIPWALDSLLCLNQFCEAIIRVYVNLLCYFCIALLLLLRVCCSWVAIVLIILYFISISNVKGLFYFVALSWMLYVSLCLEKGISCLEMANCIRRNSFETILLQKGK